MAKIKKMAKIVINTHDFLGKLGLIKNLLAMALEDKNAFLNPEFKEYIEKAFKTNQILIDIIKETKNGENINC